MAVLTDGEENASKEYSADDVRTRIERLIDVCNWGGVFLAANQDAIQSGNAIGLNQDCCMSFSATPHGMGMVEAMLCNIFHA